MPQSIEQGIVRWLIPTIYAICLVMVVLSDGEDRRRIVLAEDVARLINTKSPKDLEDLKALLSEHLDGVRKTRSSIENPTNSWMMFELKPRVWLTIWAEYEPATEQIAKVGMTYAGSDDVPLHNPRAALPEPLAWYLYLVVVAAGALPSWLWLYVNRANEVRRYVRVGGSFIAALPLVIFVPIGTACLLRITF